MAGDGTSRDPTRLTAQQRAWVEEFAPRVPKIAAVLRSQVPAFDLEEFISAGNEALVRVALRYDPSLGVPFGAYAYVRVRGAMIDALRMANPEPRRMRRAARALIMGQAVAVEAEREELRHAGGLDPRSFDERFDQALSHIRRTTVAVVIANTDPAYLEHFADADPRADVALEHEEMHTLVLAGLDTLDADERWLIDNLYYQERSMQEVARELGVNKSTISRRHARVLGKLAMWLERANRPAAPEATDADPPPRASEDIPRGDQDAAIPRPRGPPRSAATQADCLEPPPT